MNTPDDRWRGAAGGRNGGQPPLSAEGREAWVERSRLVYTPIAAPSILGLFGFAAATFMVASNLAGWWGDSTTSPSVLAPFAMFFGGGAQLLAGMWSYRARDGLATAMHGAWGAFWLAWGLLVLLAAGGVLPASVTTSDALGFWFIVLAVITFFGAAAALRKTIGLFATLFLLATGSTLLAAGLISSTHEVVMAAGWVLVLSACAAFYTAGSMLLEESNGGEAVIPLGHLDGRVDGAAARRVRGPIGYPAGFPGAKVGQ